MSRYVLAALTVSRWQKKPGETESPHLLAVKRQLAAGRWPMAKVPEAAFSAVISRWLFGIVDRNRNYTRSAATVG